MKALDRKLLRDLLHMKGQVITISLVVACGIASFVTYRSTWISLTQSRAAYYDRYRFADVFAQLKRAPLSVKGRLEQTPGVARVHTRIVRYVRIFVDGLPEPATGQLVSVPIRGPVPLNDLRVTQGRMVDSIRDDEVVLGEPFAKAHGLIPGDTLSVIINGAWQKLTIVGLATSPEFVFSVAPQSIISDDRRFTPLWMSRSAVGPAFDMEGAFNDVLVDLYPGTQEAPVFDAIDRELEVYGGLGAYGRRHHPSDAMLSGELQQVEAMVLFAPLVFLGVAAFLLNVVLSRLVFMQRPEIATLKAVGYSNRRIAIHYLEFVVLVVLIGAGVGIAVGARFARELADVFVEINRLPLIGSRLDLPVVIDAVLISMVAGVGGGLVTLKGVVQLPPAEAMRPPAPVTYRRSILDRLGAHGFLSPSARLVVREIERRPLRTLVSAAGVSFAVGILVLGRFGRDAFEPIIDLQFGAVNREDVSVAFAEPISDASLRYLENIPGVLHVEGLRYVPIRLRHGHRWRDTVIAGIPEQAQLHRPHGSDFSFVSVPGSGIMLSRILAEILSVGVGDEVEVRVREGQRSTRRLTVTRLVDDVFGVSGYMNKRSLHRMLGEEPVLSTALLEVDGIADEDVLARLRDIPNAASIVRKATVLERFKGQSQQTMIVVTLILTIFAGAVAVGVVYNNARVALSVRGRDLASLRVLGFTRQEITVILLGEQAIQVLLSLPLGLYLGTWAARAIVTLQADPETWRLPIVISSRSYSFAVLVVVGAAVFSGLLLRRRLARLDLIGVLKTRE